MSRAALFLNLVIFLFGTESLILAQNTGDFHLLSTPEICEPGSAGLQFEKHENDSVGIEWSNGARDVQFTNNLSAGEYSVKIKVVRYNGAKRIEMDSSIVFKIEKEQCPLSVPKYFSPNDDGYNDRFEIGNIHKYPNFEFIVYNKWGQRVHYQKEIYIPWDGKWLGTDLPDGTYYFIIFYDRANQDHMLKGDVTILR